MLFLVGIDDHDSHFGGCTTYVAYRLIRELIKEKLNVVPLPALVRLNPYVPFKTRGNAAVRITINVEGLSEKDLAEHIQEIVDRYRERRGKADPGIAVTCIDNIEKLKILYKVYKKAITDIVTSDQIDKICNKLNIYTRGGRGKIGAVACLGFLPDKDLTFELLAYGDPSVKKNINIDIQMFSLLNNLFRPYTFANIDVENEKILIFPSGPDPVIYGVRGDSPLHVIFLSSLVQNIAKIDIEGWLLFHTNQATGIHIEYSENNVRTFNPHRTMVKIVKISRTEDRHLQCFTDKDVNIFSYRHIGDPCTFLERSLGDIVEVWGGLRIKDCKYFIYVEGCRKLSRRLVQVSNPRCPRCGSTLKSLGKGKGFFCKKCNIKITNVHKIVTEEHVLPSKLFSLPYLSEFRHLMKPIERVGIEGFSNMFNELNIPMWIL